MHRRVKEGLIEMGHLGTDLQEWGVNRADIWGAVGGVGRLQAEGRPKAKTLKMATGEAMRTHLAVESAARKPKRLGQRHWATGGEATKGRCHGEQVLGSLRSQGSPGWFWMEEWRRQTSLLQGPSFFHWSGVDLQCRAGFTYTAKWFSDAYLYTYLFFFRFFSIIAYYKILNIIPCAIQ